MSQQQWSSDQRRQQIAEMLRNKGVICRDFLCTGRCPRTPTCSYMHVASGETRPVPWSVCTFFTQGKCLRDRCSFFHGTQIQLEELHATGVSVYRPQDYMKVAVPPPQYLNPDGSICTNVSITPLAPAPALHVVHSPVVQHENAVNAFHPVLLMQPVPQAIAASPFFAAPGHAPNPAQQPFYYTNAPLAATSLTPAPTTVFQQAVPAMQPTAYYQASLVPAQQQYAPSAQFNTPHQAPPPQRHSIQSGMSSHVFYQI